MGIIIQFLKTIKRDMLIDSYKNKYIWPWLHYNLKNNEYGTIIDMKQLIAETTIYGTKQMLKERKPKSS